ncbi:MAG: hypothetical protein OMM_11094, partial [Candidatus Magnetoglobus multicellularis str. Araruama]
MTDGDTMISGNAKTELLAAINLYFEASAFIRNEQDDQTDDLLQIDDDKDHYETEFQEDLIKIEQSINETMPVTIGEIETDIETLWYIMMEPDSGSQHLASWWVITDEFNTLKHSGSQFHSSCIDFSHGCYGEIVTYEKSDDLLTVLAVSSDGTSITYTGTLTADESAIVSGTYIATYYDYNGKNTVTGNFSGSKEYSDTRVEDNTLTVNAGEIFNDPIDIRSYLPELATDPYTHDILIVSESSFPDRTFSGILPDKWPTKGDVYIDKVRVWGEYDGLSLHIQMSGISPWHIKEMYVNTPVERLIFEKPFNVYNDYANRELWFSTYTQDLAQGNYEFVVIDNWDNKYTLDKHYTFNYFQPIDTSQIFPGSSVNTTTPTFSWPDVPSYKPAVPKYELHIRTIFDPFIGYKTIHYLTLAGTNYIIPDGILQNNKYYKWWLYIKDHSNVDIANNFDTLISNVLYIGDASDFKITNAIIRSEQSLSYTRTIIDLDTVGWSEDIAISNSGPINNLMLNRDVPYASQRAYTIIPNSIPDGIYNFIMEKAGQTISYSVAYSFQSIPVAQGLTVTSKHDNDYIYTTMPQFIWQPVSKTGVSLYTNIQIFEYISDNLIYESPVSLKTQATIPANILKANNAYRYRVMVYDSPTNAQNVSVTDFQVFYIKITDPALMLTIPTSANEKDGMLAQKCAVYLNTVPVKDVVITFTSMDTSEIKVPATLTIPKGQMSATFSIQVIDDDELDNDQTVSINATAIGWEPGSASITVIDDDEDWKSIDL